MKKSNDISNVLKTFWHYDFTDWHHWHDMVKMHTPDMLLHGNKQMNSSVKQLLVH